LCTRPFEAGRSFSFAGGGDLGFFPRDSGGVLKNRRMPRSMRRAISADGMSSGVRSTICRYNKSIRTHR
jgi:hypothetical protein